MTDNIDLLSTQTARSAGAQSLTQFLEATMRLLEERERTGSVGTTDLQQLVARDGPAILESFLDGERYAVNGRFGMGSIADVPWIGVFPATSAKSAQTGVYVVYLFAKDGSTVYLSLNQGTEGLRGGLHALEKRVLDIRRVAGLPKGLEIELDLKSGNDRPRRYSAGSAYAFAYRAGSMPDDQVLRADLHRLLEGLGRVEASGLSFHPETEPTHLLFKWNADTEPETVNIHRELADSHGSVWWGRFAGPQTPQVGMSNVAQLQWQLDNDTPTYAFLYRRGDVWRTRVHQVESEATSLADDPRFPSYYSPEDCNFFVRLGSFDHLPAGWAADNLVLASNPHPEKTHGALTNQTTPLFVYELQTGEDIMPPPPIEPLSTRDLAEVVTSLRNAVDAAQLRFREEFLRVFVTSLATKRFLIITGLSGSGKTRIAQAFGEWLGASQHLIVAVRPDWTSPDALLGYENGLSDPDENGYHAWNAPEALQFMLRASADQDSPYLLVLDEMNLAHVERYFADVLSGMESGHPVLPNLARTRDSWRVADPSHPRVPLPTNLFVIGTVNVDETTYMFSPKVLDRANTIEFRVGSEDLLTGAAEPRPIASGETELQRSFLEHARRPSERSEGADQLAGWLRHLHQVLSQHDREFGHRVFQEALRFADLFATAGEPDPLAAFDVQVLQKVLPKFHGSIREINDPLNALGAWAFHGPDEFATGDFDPLDPPDGEPVLPRSYDKIRRMTRRLRANHFVSFTE